MRVCIKAKLESCRHSRRATVKDERFVSQKDVCVFACVRLR